MDWLPAQPPCSPDLNVGHLCLILGTLAGDEIYLQVVRPGLLPVCACNRLFVAAEVEK